MIVIILSIEILTYFQILQIWYWSGQQKPFFNINFELRCFENGYIHKCTVYAGSTSAKTQCVFLKHYL